MVDQISSRKDFSVQLREKASKALESRVDDWTDAKTLKEKVCVYTTGSFGREDACEHSDLDVFVTSRVASFSGERLLTGLEEIELCASIIGMNRDINLPDIDADGGFLKAHSASEYLIGLGKPSDDANNTFTGRLLLLLESRCLFGKDVYENIIEECIERYWIDYADHSGTFIPAFLMNDILRFWRTLCINYEAGTHHSPAKRRAKNFKLKFSRLLTCYSVIIGLQVRLCEEGSVSKEQAKKLVSMRPLERIDIAKAHGASSNVNAIREMYEFFLVETNCSKSALYDKMSDEEYYGKTLESARQFGDEIFQLIRTLSKHDVQGSPSWRFLRYITV
jgi:predicted nucleotidyltransferase